MGTLHDALAAVILGVERPHPVRVAVDGCSAAGKTTLADKLAGSLRERTGREVVRAGLDYFKKPAGQRRTDDSPEEYYYDYWDYPGVQEKLLLPFGPGGSRRYVTALRDASARHEAGGEEQVAADDAILVVDGAFLQRPELDGHWDLRIYVDISFETVQRRGHRRDAAWMPSLAAAEERDRTKYVPGEQIYVREVNPRDRADIVIDNEDLAHPRRVR